MITRLLGLLLLTPVRASSAPRSDGSAANDGRVRTERRGLGQRRLGLTRQEARDAKLEDIMWSWPPSADGHGSNAPPPNAGPVEGVSYWYAASMDKKTPSRSLTRESYNLPRVLPTQS